MTNPKYSTQIESFVLELSSFAQIAEETLGKIEADLEGNKNLFSVFSAKMFTIRGTAVQLNLTHVAEIAELGEEIAVKGAIATGRPQIRKCVGSLWDALTTVKFLIQNHDKPTTEEQDILKNRLFATLRTLGGARQKVDANDIEALLQASSLSKSK